MEPQSGVPASAPDTPDLEEPLLAPLLRPPPHAIANGDGGGPPVVGLAAAEAKRIWIIGGPLALEELICYLSTLICFGMLGRLGGFALGVYTLAHSITNITGIAFLSGVTGAVDTFSSQAHGFKAYKAIGLVLQRALVVSLLTCVPLLVLYAFAHPLLLALGQQPHLAAEAARYIHLFAPMVPLHAVNLCLYRTLASQGATMYVLAAGTFFCAVTAPINWLLIFKLRLGLDGSALAFVALEAIYCMCLIGMCVLHNWRRNPAERWWGGWSRDALRGWGPFLRLSAAATAMVICDWWLYDLLTLLAGLLPNPDVALAACGIIYNINTLVFTLSYGLSYAMCARVGQLLGAIKPRAAKLAGEVGTAMGLAVAGAACLILLPLRHQVAELFTDDEAVIEACSALMLPLAALLISNGATALQSGILHGCARQKMGALVNGIANYGFGLPAMLLLAFYFREGAAGLWWGITASTFLQAAILQTLITRFDWQAEAERAARLVHHLSSGHLLTAAFSGELVAAHSAEAVAPLRVRGL